jgi:hypothetical protein
VGGVPAKLIRYRFSPEEIASLKEIQWWTKDQKWIRERADLFDNVQSFIKIVTNNDRHV